jgi:Tol biopolymer transport system component
MKSRLLIILTLGVLLVWSAGPFAEQTREDVALRAAIETEMVKGDLKAAIDQYKKVIAAGDRTVAVKALLHIAECYQKLGDAQAQDFYERVVREYPDQKEAAIARARLDASGSARHTTATTLRTVWTGPKVDPNGAVSPDGRLLTFSDWDTGDLAIHDLTTGSDRRLTNKGSWAQSSALAEDSVVSRDGKYVAYAWCDCRNRYSLRMLPVRGDATAQPRVVYDNESIAWIAPFDWSPDGKRIAVQLLRQDDRTAQLGWVTVDDGSLHVLKSIDWRRSGKLLFSPDGKYLAYDLPVDDTTQRDVFLIALDGSRELPIAASPARDVVVGWAPDGSRLLFASDRSGSASLWAISIRDGRPIGSPELIKADIGDVGQKSLGLTAAGTLLVATPVGGVDIYVGSLDVSSGDVAVNAVRTGDKLVGFNRQPDWSPDGTLLAYVSSRAANGRDTTTIAIQSAESGKVIRQIQPQLSYAEFPRWTPDGQSLIVYGWDLKGGVGVYRIDAQSGKTVRIVEGDLHGPQMSNDNTKLYATRLGPRMALVEVGVTSGRQREIVEGDDLSPPALSPDGRWLAVRASEPSAKSSAILLTSVDSGDIRELSRLNQPQSFVGNVSWVADGRSLVVRRTRPGSPPELLLMPLDGSEARKLQISVPAVTTAPVRVHPDGRRIAVTAGQNRWEVLALENFLPAPTASK